MQGFGALLRVEGLRHLVDYGYFYVHIYFLGYALPDWLIPSRQTEQRREEVEIGLS
jgi:hypothetical protein